MINSYADSQSRRGTIYRAFLPFLPNAFSPHSVSRRFVFFSVASVHSVLKHARHQQQISLSAKIEMTV
jgi:hypothetical protein